jgi:hypothetical protein
MKICLKKCIPACENVNTAGLKREITNYNCSALNSMGYGVRKLIKRE